MHGLRSPWRAVAAMFVLNGALFGIWASRIPAIAERHDLAPGILGLLLLCLALGAIVAFPFAGRAADRIGAASVTRWIAVGYVVFLIALALSSSVWLLALSLLLFGAFHGAMDVTMNAWAAEVEKALSRPVMASFHAMFSVGAGLGAGSGYLAVGLGFGVLMHFALASLVIAAVAFWFSAIAWASERSGGQSGPVFLWPKGPLLLVGLVAFCSSLGEGAMADWSAIFLVLAMQASEAEAALGYTVFSITMVLMRFAGDRLVVIAGPVYAARMSGVAALAGSLIAVFGSDLITGLVGFGLMGVGYAVVMPLAFSRAARSPHPGSGIASVATLGYGGMLLGPVLVGAVAELSSIRLAFLLLSALALMIVLMSSSLEERV